MQKCVVNLPRSTDLSAFEKVQGDLYILQLVEAHSAFLPRLQETRRRVKVLFDQQTQWPHD